MSPLYGIPVFFDNAVEGIKIRGGIIWANNRELFLEMLEWANKREDIGNRCVNELLELYAVWKKASAQPHFTGPTIAKYQRELD